MNVNRILYGLFLLVSGTTSLLAAEYPARLDWSQRLELSSLLSGVVAEVRVNSGARVAKGSLLLRLDQRGLKADSERAKALLGHATQRYEEALREKGRADELYERTLLSQHDLQQAHIGHSESLAQLEVARANSTSARLALEYSALHAPFNAIILKRWVEPGETVVNTLQGTPLLTLARSDTMVARMQLLAEALQTLTKGQSVVVRVGSRDYRGEILFLGLEPGELGTHEAPRYPVEVQFATGDATLRAGQPAMVSW